MESIPKTACAGRDVTIRIHAVDPEERPAEDLVVEAYLHQPGADRDKPSALLVAKGGGNYEGKVHFDSGGTWQMDVVASKKLEHSRQRFEFDVGPAPAVESHTDHRESWQAPGDDDGE
jgi:nitrogen fixation protein FixH